MPGSSLYYEAAGAGPPVILLHAGYLDRRMWDAQTDRYWNAIVGNGGQESQCGWCKDKWGISWQITPRVLTDALARGGDGAKRAFQAMMPMTKIDVAAIEAAVHAE